MLLLVDPSQRFWLCVTSSYWWLSYLMLILWLCDTCCYWWLPYLTLRSRCCKTNCYDWICNLMNLMSGWWMCGIYAPGFSRSQHLPSTNSLWPVIIKLFPARESLVSDIPARDGKTANLVYSMTMNDGFIHCSARDWE
jgi:hypothetical protein